MEIRDRRYTPKVPIPYDVPERGPSGTSEQRYIEALVNQPGTSPIQGSTAQLLAKIASNSDIASALQTIGLAFAPRVINILPLNGPNNATQIIEPAFAPRGYVIQNPGELSGFSSQVTFFPSLLRIPATYTSTSFNVSGIDSARIFLDVTAQAAGGTLVVNAQTQDPLTGLWATSQADIFGGSAAVGTYYASLGSLGVDRTIRLQAVVGVNDETFSISGLFKGAAPTPVGSTVYIGGPDVNPTMGFAILPGSNFFFYLQQNVSLFAITATDTLSLKVFQLQ